LRSSDSTWPTSLLVQQHETGGLDFSLELPPALGVLAVLLLVLLNGFFVATEFALVAVRRSRIEQLVAEGHRTASIVKQALQHLDTYIAATQFGITVASLALGWIGEPALARLIDPLLIAILPPEWVETGSYVIAVTLSFIFITALHIVMGELAPKGIALQKPEATALAVAIPISIFLKVFKPFIIALNGTGNLMLRLLGFRAAREEEHVHTVEELRYLVRSSREAGVFGSTEEEIVGRALKLGDLTAHNVMVHRTEMTAVSVDIALDKLLNLAGREHHVRFPVYEGNHDSIVGMIYLTDALAWGSTHPDEQFSVRAAMRPPLFVPESIKGDKLIAQMRSARTHTALVIDEFGSVSGLVTLQDLVERIVGEIPEVDEETPPEMETLPDGSVRVDGLTPVADVQARFGLGANGMQADTIGGYVLETMGRVPEVGDVVDLGAYKLRVTQMDGTRVAQIILSK
jgi:putative hemolysin